MNKIYPRFFLLIIFLSSLFISISAQPSKEITILHWNDFHSNNVPFKIDKKYYPELKEPSGYIGGSAYLAAYIDKYKALSKNVILLNAGDDFQGSPVSTITKGKSQIEIMNLINPDAVTLGNHEFDYSADSLFYRLKSAKFDIISANLINKANKQLFFKPYKIIEKDGLKIAVIGLMTLELPTLSFPDNIRNIEIKDIFSISRRYSNELKKSKQADMIILLSHCGIEYDEALADSIPDVDVIVGGHSHTTLKKPLKRNKAIIVQAGDKGRFLGKLVLTYDMKTNSISSFEGELIPTINSEITPRKDVQELVDKYESIASKGLDEVIGYLETDWVRGHGMESNIGNWETDVIKEYTKADIAFQNSGGIRKNLSAGDIKIRDIWEINPFGNLLVSFPIRGDSLKMAIEFQVAGNSEILQVSGLKFSFDDTKPASNRLVDFKVNGKDIDNNQYYNVGANNYIAQQGKKYFGFEIPSSSLKNFQALDRDVFIEAVKKQKRINSIIENRFRKIK